MLLKTLEILHTAMPLKHYIPGYEKKIDKILSF